MIALNHQAVDTRLSGEDEGGSLNAAEENRVGCVPWAKLKTDGPTFSKQSAVVGPGRGRLPLSFLHSLCITSSLLTLPARYGWYIAKASALELP